MAKKMKGVAFDSSLYGSYEDPKARFKHQTLMQDYRELHLEVEGARNKLETMKHRKLTLLAEVRFLRRRHRFLSKNKSLNSAQEQEFVRPQYVETQHKSSKNARVHSKKEASSVSLPPIFNPNQNRRKYMEKKNVLPNPPVFNLNHKNTLHSVKGSGLYKATQESNLKHRVTYGGMEAAFRKPMLVAELIQKDRLNGAAALRNPSRVFDLNQKESAVTSKETSIPSRAPAFDLNQVSLEEQESQENYEPFNFEEVRSWGLSRVGNDEQHNDLKLLVCRNIGDASTSRPGKRKISWQDPVALRV